MSEQSRRRDFRLREMDCVTCALRLEKELRKIPGVKEAHANLVLERVTVTYDPQQVDVQTLETGIERLGYRLPYKKYRGFVERILAWFKASGTEPPLFKGVRSNEFQDLVLGSLKPTVLWVTSDRCPSCRTQIPALKRLSERYAGLVYFYQMDVMQARSVKGYEQVEAPALLLFDRGLVVHRYTGLFDETVVEEQLAGLVRA